jgi:hypothetical protein
VKTVEIYGLYDPDTDELRYVGKANNAKKRLKTHVFERGYRRPVNKWVKSLVEAGKAPVMKILETVAHEQWEEAERRLIAEYRKTCRLLNLADGGARPTQTTEQRRQAAKAANKARKAKHPAEIALEDANRNLSRLHARFQKQGAYIHAYHLKFMMRCHAALQDGMSPAIWLTL